MLCRPLTHRARRAPRWPWVANAGESGVLVATAAGASDTGRWWPRNGHSALPNQLAVLAGSRGQRSRSDARRVTLHDVLRLPRTATAAELERRARTGVLVARRTCLCRTRKSPTLRSGPAGSG